MQLSICTQISLPCVLLIRSCWTFLCSIIKQMENLIYIFLFKFVFERLHFKVSIHSLNFDYVLFQWSFRSETHRCRISEGRIVLQICYVLVSTQIKLEIKLTFVWLAALDQVMHCASRVAKVFKIYIIRYSSWLSTFTTCQNFFELGSARN